MSILSTGPLQATSAFGPFTSLINVYGLKILGLGNVGGQAAVQGEFLKKTAQTFKLLLNPSAAGIDQSARTKALQGLNTYNVIQRVGVASYGSYSPALHSLSGWDDVNDNNPQTDFIWHLKDDHGNYSPSGDSQATEALEHALHTLSQFAFPAAFPTKMNVSSSNGSFTGISGDLKAAYDEAVNNGVYDPSDYAGRNDGSEEYGQLVLREYLYCLIFAEWGYTSALTEGGSLAPEWSDAHLNSTAIANDNPLWHQLFTNNISKLISKPSLLQLRSIYQNVYRCIGVCPSQRAPSPRQHRRQARRRRRHPLRLQRQLLPQRRRRLRLRLRLQPQLQLQLRLHFPPELQLRLQLQLQLRLHFPPELQPLLTHLNRPQLLLRLQRQLRLRFQLQHQAFPQPSTS